ncbi:midcut-by-XrtH protein [Halioglobus sp. HI00S01]|uniref:midcut-by-XrtH protein n=1 Tax=Halioglobus sp. HI00S01 TaxID=1822214 RepID=UPI0018D4255C|nr:midcut-by-XrtH protein [Halioglobus sp. HI00S01]
MSIKHAWAAISSLTLSSVAFAQTSGTLTYGPASVTAAPTPVDSVAPAVPVSIPSLLLVPLGVFMAVIGYRALRGPQGRKLLSVMLLGAGLTLSALGSLNIPQALASMLELDNPEGGEIDLPVGQVEISNTSGVALKLDVISIESSCLSQDPANECASGQILEAGDSCMIDNACASETQKVLFVTSQTYTGDLRENGQGSGIEGADAKCNALATEANLPGEFFAYLSSEGLTFNDRYGSLDAVGVPFYRTNGDIVASTGGALIRGPAFWELFPTVIYDERGTILPDDSRLFFWSNSLGPDTYAPSLDPFFSDCSNYTSNDPALTFPSSSEANSQFYGNFFTGLSRGFISDCSSNSRLLCIEQ